MKKRYVTRKIRENKPSDMSDAEFDYYEHGLPPIEVRHPDFARLFPKEVAKGKERLKRLNT